MKIKNIIIICGILVLLFSMALYTINCFPQEDLMIYSMGSIGQKYNLTLNEIINGKESICLQSAPTNSTYVAFRFELKRYLENDTEWEKRKMEFHQDKFIKDYLIYDCPEDAISEANE